MKEKLLQWTAQIRLNFNFFFSGKRLCAVKEPRNFLSLFNRARDATLGINSCMRKYEAKGKTIEGVIQLLRKMMGTQKAKNIPVTFLNLKDNTITKK